MFEEATKSKLPDNEAVLTPSENNRSFHGKNSRQEDENNFGFQGAQMRHSDITLGPRKSTVRKPLWKQDQAISDSSSDVDPMEANKLLVLKILLTAIIFNRSYALVMSIMLPLYMQEHHPTILLWQTGLIVSGVQFVQIFFGPCMAPYITKTGHKNAILTSYVSCIVSMGLFSVIGFIHSDNLYFSFALIFRIIFGIGTGILNIAVLSVISIDFAENKSKYQGYYLIAEGVGALGGPIFMCFTVSWAGFHLICLLLCILQVIPFYISYKYLPERINHMDNKQRQILETYQSEFRASINNNSEERPTSMTAMALDTLTLWDLFWNLRGISICGINSVIITISMFNSTLFMLKFQEMGMKIYYAYFCTFICIFGFVPATLLFTKQTQRKGARMVILFSLLGYVASCFLMGPSNVLSIPDNATLMTIGLVFHTFFFSSGNVAIVPETYKCAEEYSRLKKNGQVLSDKEVVVVTDRSSAMVNIWKSTGFAASSIVGGLLYDIGGYEYTCDVMAFVSLFFFTAYAIACIFIKKNEEKHRDMFKRFEQEADNVYMTEKLVEAQRQSNMFYTQHLDGEQTPLKSKYNRNTINGQQYMNDTSEITEEKGQNSTTVTGTGQQDMSFAGQNNSQMIQRRTK